MATGATAPLRFHPRCGGGAKVKEGGKVLERGGRLGYSAGLTDCPLGVSEWFEIEVTKINTVYLGRLSFGVTSHSPEGIEYPHAIFTLKSGVWMLQCTSSGYIRVNGKVAKKDYIPEATLKVGDRLGLMVTPDQSLVFSQNGRDLGVAATNIPQGVYGFVDLWAQCEAVRIISHPIQPNPPPKVTPTRRQVATPKHQVQQQDRGQSQAMALHHQPSEKDAQLRQQQQLLEETLQHQQQLQDKNRELTQSATTLEEKNRVLRREMEVQQQRFDQNNQECQQLRRDHQQLQYEQRQSQQQLTTADTTIQQLRQQLQSTRATSDGTIHQLRQQLQSTRATSDGTIHQLRQQLQTMQLRHQVTPRSHLTEFWEVPRKEVTLNMHKILGTGGWGFVVEGTFRGQTVAVKCLHDLIREPEFIAVIRREIGIMAQIRHPNLVLLIAAVIDEESDPLVITELLDMSLRKAYEKKRLEGSSKLSIYRDIACALNYLHLHHHGPIIHRDVSSANVLLEAKPNNQWKAKLSDFGSAKLAREATTTGPGAPVYAAPEVRTQTGIPQSAKVDVYSYGILLCEVTAGRFPTETRFPDMLETIKETWSFMHTLITTCIQEHPDNRPTMASILRDFDRIMTPR